MATHHERLKSELGQIRYPASIIACPGPYCAIQGQSFFPGGKGNPGGNIPVGGVMYLGHNFDKVGGFNRSVERGHEENLTWRVIRTAVLPVLAERHIWFTNYFMGVVEGPSNMGPLDQSADGFADYEADCWEFFKVQLALQRPRIVVALGKEVVRLLGKSNRLDIPSWMLGPSQAFGPLRRIEHRVQLPLVDGIHETLFVAAYHPSFGRSAAQLLEVKADSEFVASLMGE